MKKKIIALLSITVLGCALLAGCGKKQEAEPEKAALEDGVYTAEFYIQWNVSRKRGT